MHESVYLGRFGRTRVAMNWSVLLIGVLVALTLAEAEFPATAPGFGDGAYWAAAIVATVLFLASLLGHELAHAAVARRHGVGVKGIVLWALGGVAMLDGDAPDAASELRIALVGPATSLGLAIAFGLAALALHALGVTDLVVATFGWLAEINALLGFFNLLPAYPLDGGRVLRAGLWRHWHDRMRATDAAARVGSAIGAALVALGLLATFLFSSFPLNGLWLALVGWFVLRASREEQRAVGAVALLVGLRVGDAMVPVTEAAPAYASVEDLLERYLRPRRLEHCPLVDFAGGLVGEVGVEDLGRVPREHWRTTRASAVAWPLSGLARAEAGEDLGEAARRLSRVASRCALVFDAGRLVGVLSAGDVERAGRARSAFGDTAGSRSSTVPER